MCYITPLPFLNDVSFLVVLVGKYLDIYIYIEELEMYVWVLAPVFLKYNELIEGSNMWMKSNL
jgi:hypothetical protein